MIPLHYLTTVTFRDHLPVPDRFRHTRSHSAPEYSTSPRVERRSSRPFERAEPNRRKRPDLTLVHLPVHHHVVVGGNALPTAGRVRGAVFEQLALYRFRREIVVSLNRFAARALGNHPPVPDGLCHVSSRPPARVCVPSLAVE
jgi:hypothetical protein